MGRDGCQQHAGGGKDAGPCIFPFSEQELLVLGRGLGVEADKKRLSLQVDAGVLLVVLWGGRNLPLGSVPFVCLPLPVDFVHSSFLGH